MIKTAAILAAGVGSRLSGIIKNKPKGFVIIDGKPIIEHSVHKLIECGIEKIILGTGYLAEVYEEFAKDYPQIKCIKSSSFVSTGSMCTLYNMRHAIHGDCLLLESDLLYEKSGLIRLLDDRNENVILASGRTGSGDEVYIEVDEYDNLINMSKNSDELNCIYSELVGITKLSAATLQKMCSFFENTCRDKPRLDYEYALVGISGDIKINVKRIDDYAWCEIDDEQHLYRALNIVYPRISVKERYDKFF